MPIVVSMGSIAASGGYYIAAEADEIWATPTTLTGSIGVFAAFPTFERLLERVGVYTDGVGTTPLAGSLRFDRPLNPQVAQTLASSVNFTYEGFLELVSAGRGLSPEAVAAVAGGRVWSAADALEVGLIDELGSLAQAVAAAAELAGLDSASHTVEYVHQALSPRELLLQQLASRVGMVGWWPGLDVGMQLLRPVATAARTLTELNDPAHLYMRCFGCTPP